MGIQGLLPLLKSIHKPCHLRKFAGQTIGVDAYGWLHRGTVSCAIDLALDKPTTKYVEFAMNRVRMLIHFGITPFLVFDGDYLPSKAKTEKERELRRKESRKLGLELLNMGRTPQAQQELQKAVDVTPEMAGLLIEELKRAKLPFIVAPYEADSQLAYLEKKGDIQAVLSEDSDLLVFGVRVLLTKLDQYGECVMIRRDDFTACREISLVGWSDAEFRRMAILSGCDYLASVDKMGLKTAYRLIRKHKSIDRVVRSLQFDGKFRVPAGYLEDFNRAEMTFLYQWVYCPAVKGLVNFCEPDKGVDPLSMKFIGSPMEASVAREVACGALHPHTKERLVLPPVPGRGRFSRSSAARKENVPPQTVEGKKSKPIEAFFRPKHRIPLAELDPNMFTPSPTQQDMMRRASGASWPATPTPILQAVRQIQPAFTAPARRTASESWVRSASGGLRAADARPESSAIRHAMAGNPSRFETSSVFKSAKRPRLCDEGSSPVQDTKARSETGRSRFFGSPSKRKKQNTHIWPDDSLDEALMDLPDPGVFRSATRSRNPAIVVFADEEESQRARGSRDSEETSQGTVFTASDSVCVAGREPLATPASSVEEEQDGEDRLDTLQTASLTVKFGYQPASETSGQPDELRRAEGAGEVTTKQIHVPESDPIEGTDDELPSVSLTGFSTGELEVTVPEPQNAVLSGTAAIKGSEDFLVSESEAESVASPIVATKVLNISRFAFMP